MAIDFDDTPSEWTRSPVCLDPRSNRFLDNPGCGVTAHLSQMNEFAFVTSDGQSSHFRLRSVDCEIAKESHSILLRYLLKNNFTIEITNMKSDCRHLSKE